MTLRCWKSKGEAVLAASSREIKDTALKLEDVVNHLEDKCAFALIPAAVIPVCGADVTHSTAEGDTWWSEQPG